MFLSHILNMTDCKLKNNFPYSEATGLRAAIHHIIISNECHVTDTAYETRIYILWDSLCSFVFLHHM